MALCSYPSREYVNAIGYSPSFSLELGSLRTLVNNSARRDDSHAHAFLHILARAFAISIRRQCKCAHVWPIVEAKTSKYTPKWVRHSDGARSMKKYLHFTQIVRFL